MAAAVAAKLITKGQESMTILRNGALHGPFRRGFNMHGLQA
jgi:hypothetical protein